jgi:ankyrin repeat protein
MNAARNGNNALVSLLLSHHADSNENSDAGPALSSAVESDKAETVVTPG